MSFARRIYGAIGRLFGFGRLMLAVGLLVALWMGTVRGVERSSKDADERRASDRSAMAEAFAASVGEWLDAGRGEATTLARSIGAGSSQRGAIDALLGRPRTFAQSALIFSGSVVTASSAEHAVLVGFHPNACTRTDEQGTAVADRALDELLDVARTRSSPVVSRIFDVPGRCEPAVGIAVASGSLATVVLGDIADVSSRLIAGSHMTDGKIAGATRMFLVTGDLALEPRLGIVATPPRVAEFVRGVVAGGPHRVRYPIGEAGDAEVVAAYARAAPGWAVVLEQDAAVFDIELQQRPSVIVATFLTVVFAVVFALLALFDVRRRRAQRRAEVAKNAFFSIAGHELRTPLTVIRGFAETLSSHWDDVTDDRRRALVERIVPQALRLDRLVERLLVAASIQAETHTRPQVRAIDPVPALGSVADRFRDQAPLHSFLVEVPRRAVRVLGDPRSLEQVLDHLVDNAVKYSPAGGRVRLRMTGDQQRVQLIVEDEGVGLPSDHRRIFDKFAQGETVTKRVHDEGGVGLGLYIVRTLVEDMGGSVAAEPRPEGGARFIVYLRAGHARDDVAPAA
jgi:signal transduction histidine kinase